MSRKRPRNLRSRDGDRGVALIVVLCLLALLTLVATTLTMSSIGYRRSIAQFALVVRGDSIADSAIRVTLLTLLAPKAGGTSWPYDASKSIRVLDTDVDVTVEREAERIDLNTASEEFIVAAFAANGWSETDARLMAAGIQGWKRADDRPRAEGVKRDAYMAARLDYGPHHNGFQSIDELRQLSGGERITAALLDAFTVYSHAQAPLETSTNAAVRRTLAWIAMHDPAARHGLPEVTSQASSVVGRDQNSPTGEVLRVSACLIAHQHTGCRRVIGRLTGSMQKPVQVFVWDTTMLHNP